MLMTVGDVIADLQSEDSGVTASLLSAGMWLHIITGALVLLVRLGSEQLENGLVRQDV